MKGYLVLLLLLCSTTLSLSKFGLDLSIYLPTSSWSSTISTAFTGVAVNSSFLVIHGYFYNNTVNGPGLQSIQSAWAAGCRDISVYFFPCIPTSPYATGNSITCGTPQAQLNKFLTSLTNSGIHFQRTNQSSSSLNPSYVYLKTLFINVEDTAPNFYFSQHHHENMQYLLTFIKYAQSKGIEIGFYTTPLDWKIVMTNALPVTHFTDIRHYVYPLNESYYIPYNPFSKFKLWVPRYDKVNSMSFFTSFANWTTVFMKQTSGSTSDFRRIGSSRLGTNYRLANNNQTYGYVSLTV